MLFRFLFPCIIIFSCNQSKKSPSVQDAKIDSFIVKINEEVHRYWDKLDADSAEWYLNHLGDTIRQIDNKKLTNRWNLQKVQHFIAKEQYDSATIYLNEAKRILSSYNTNYKDSFHFYMVSQKLLTERKLFDSALLVQNEVYQLVLRNDTSRITIVALELARMYHRLNDFPNTRKYMLEAWNNREKEPGLIPSIAALMLNYYHKVNRFDSAMYYTKVIEENPGLFAIQPAGIALLYENIATYHLKDGRTTEALNNLMKSKNILDSIGVKNGFVYNNLADTYMRLGQYKKAFILIDTAISIGHQERDYYLLELSWRTKSEILSKTTQYKLAYASLDSSFTYYITKMDSSLRNHARELETRYAVREKDARIKALALTNAASLKISEQQRLIILILVVTAILTTIIGVLVWNRRQVQIRVREADLRQQVLRAQMEPHFLFNMLGLLQAHIRNNNQEQSALVLNKFSRILRSILENGRNKFVRLSDEISDLENYLTLQTILQENKFEFAIDIDESIQKDEVWMPPMLLQPFAENAIEHGFKGMSNQRKLFIKVTRRPNFLHFTINDNGIGLDLTKQKVNNRYHAIEIAKDRLDILGKQTRKKTQLEIIDKKSRNEGPGVRVEMAVPYLNSDIK